MFVISLHKKHWVRKLEKLFFFFFFENRLIFIIFPISHFNTFFQLYPKGNYGIQIFLKSFIFLFYNCESIKILIQYISMIIEIYRKKK